MSTFSTPHPINAPPYTPQVTYSHKVARQVVTAPLVLLMTLPFMLDMGGLRSRFGTALLPAVTRVLIAAALCMASLLGGLIAPAAIGVARVVLLGALITCISHIPLPGLNEVSGFDDANFPWQWVYVSAVNVYLCWGVCWFPVLRCAFPREGSF